MTTNKSSHTARVWMRRLAASLVGLTLVLMVAAGVYSRANIRSTVGASEFDNSIVNNGQVNLPSVVESESTAAAQKNSNEPKTPPPPPSPPSEDMQPPSPPQDMQPPSSPQNMQPPSSPQNMQPPSPPQSMQPPTGPQNMQAPSAPQGTAPSPMQPPTPPAPIAPAATRDKFSESKKNDESSQEKKDVKVKGKLIEAPRPEYPEEAKKQKVEGTVEVTITIGEEGKVVFARAKSGPPLLHDASVAAAYKARFEPSTIDGKPVKVTGTMTYNFKLDEN